MKSLFKALPLWLLIMPLTHASTATGALTLHADNIGAWNFFVDNGELGDEVTANSLATLQLVSPEGRISVNIRRLDQPVPAALVHNDSISAWRAYVFSGKHNYKISPTEESVRNHKGNLEYLIVFHNEDGTQLNTAELVTVLNGRAYAVIYEMPIPLFNSDFKKVKPLLENIDLSLVSR